MSARAIASLSLTFGLVSIPVKVYSATESSAAVRFRLMGRGGMRLRQQYVADEDDGIGGAAREAQPNAAADPDRSASRGSKLFDGPKQAATQRSAATQQSFPPSLRSAPEPEALSAAAEENVTRGSVVDRDDIVKGYEFEKGRFVLFTPAELKALQESARQTIDIVSFIPAHVVDPIYYDKAYFLAPDKRGEKTYSLLLAAMRRSERCALAKWAWRSKQYVVQIRPVEGGMVLQQLLYADEVRSVADLGIPLVDVNEPELTLALQLIEQISEAAYDPSQFVDEEKERILAAVERKIAGQQIVATETPAPPLGGQVIDLMAALRASLRTGAPKPARTGRSAPASALQAAEAPVLRKAARRGAKPAPAPVAVAPLRSRARK